MKLAQKKIILNAAIAQKESVISDFSQRIKDLMANDGNVNEEKYDRTDQSMIAINSDDVELLTTQMNLAKQELADLIRLRDTVSVHTHVAPGSIVQTNVRTFLVSASIEQFRVNNSLFHGVSVDSPIYKTMMGLKAGDAFKLGTTKYHVAKVF